MSKSINQIVIDLLNLAAAIDFGDEGETTLLVQDDIRTLANVINEYRARAEMLEGELTQKDQQIEELVLALANEAESIRAAAIENSRHWLIRQIAAETTLDAPTVKAAIDVLTGSSDSPIGRWDREDLIAAIEDAADAVAVASEKSHHGMDDIAGDDIA